MKQRLSRDPVTPTRAIATSLVILSDDQNNIGLSGYRVLDSMKRAVGGLRKAPSPERRERYSCADTWVMLSYLQPATLTDKVQHFSFLYLHVKEPVCERQHQTAAQNISGGTAGSDRENPGDVGVLHLV